MRRRYKGELWAVNCSVRACTSVNTEGVNTVHGRTVVL